MKTSNFTIGEQRLLNVYTQQQAREAAAAEQARRNGINAGADAQQAKVNQLNKFQQDKADYAASQGNSYNLISYSRSGTPGLGTPGTPGFKANAATQIVGTAGYDPNTGFAKTGVVIPNSQIQFDRQQNYTPSQQSLLAGIRQSFSTKTGTGIASTGELQDHAIERMREAGFTDDQIRQELETSKHLISQVASNTGLGGSFDANGNFVPAGGNPRILLGGAQPPSATSNHDAVEAKYHDITMSGGSIDPAQKARDLAEADAKDKAAADQFNADQKTKSDTSAMSTATTPTPTQIGTEAATSNLPPEAQSSADAYKKVLDAIEQAKKDQAATTDALLNGGTINVNGKDIQVKGVNSQFDEQDALIAETQAANKQASEKIQQMVDDQKEYNDKYIAKQEAAAQNALLWKEQSDLRKAAKDQQAAIDTKIARLALAGKAGSDGALRDVEGTRANFESVMQDIRTQFGVDSTNLAVKFTGMFLESSNAYITASTANIKDTAAALERTNGQRLALKSARNAAEQEIIKNFVSQTISDRKEYAKTVSDHVKEMQATINQDRDDKRAQEQLGWNILDDAIARYGNLVPDSTIARVSAMLPAGADIRDYINTPTIAERNSKRISGAGGSGGTGSYTNFSASNYNSVGMPPSLNDYIAQRFKETQNARPFGPGMTNSPTDLEKRTWTKEWESKLSAHNYLEPSAIQKDFDKKLGSNILPGNKIQLVTKRFNELMKQKDFEGARNVVDGIGNELNSGDLKPIVAMSNVKSSLKEMRTLLNSVKDKVGAIQGNFWEWANEHVSSDPDIARLVAIRDIELAPIAKGVGGQTGMITDQDAKQALNSLVSLDRSYDANLAVLDQTESLIQSNLTTTLNLYKKTGKKVDQITPYVFGEQSFSDIPNPNSDAIDSIIDSSLTIK